MSIPPAGYRTVPVPLDRLDEFRTVDQLAFASPPNPEVEASLPFPMPQDRLVAVEGPDGTYAAVHGSYALDLPVPGGTVACSGLSWVGVRPDHRRRGLLRAMVTTHVERSLERGEPVSALFAAESGIYGRFGYGSAADDLRMTLPRGAALRPVPGTEGLTVHLERADPDRHADLVHDLDVRAAAGRPGRVPRTSAAVRARTLADPPSWRDGFEPLLLATVRDGQEVRGLALLARKEAWAEQGPAHTVRVRLVAALDAAATHRLWSFLLDLDLTTTVETPALPVDDPLLQLLVDLRPARARIADNLWVRLLDLPTALTARTYALPGDVVLDVADTLVPANAGRWRLLVDPAGAAEVTRTHREPDVHLDVRELGALYLGGRSATALGTAGLVAGDGAVLDRLTVAFRSPLAPVCSWMF